MSNKTTKINQSDLKFYPPERLNDTDEGGGLALGTSIQGEANEIFDPPITLTVYQAEVPRQSYQQNMPVVWLRQLSKVCMPAKLLIMLWRICPLLASLV